MYFSARGALAGRERAIRRANGVPVEEPSPIEEPVVFPLGFAPLGNSYQIVAQLVNGSRVKETKLNALLERLGGEAVDDFVDFCILEESTDKHEMAAKTIRRLEPFATKASKPLCVLDKKSVIETGAVTVDMDISHDKFNRLCLWFPGVFEHFIRWGSIENKGLKSGRSPGR